jgi:WD40 repeat protein
LLWLLTIAPAILLAWWLWERPRAWFHVARIEAGMEDTGTVRAVAFSPDGKNLAVGYAGKIAVVPLDDSKRFFLGAGASGHQRNLIRSVAWSPDGRYLTACGDGGWWIWRIADRQEVHASDVPAGSAAVAVGPEGRNFVCARAGLLRLWKRQTREEVRIDLDVSFAATTRAVRFDSSGDLVGVGTDQAVTLFDLNRRSVRYVIGGQAVAAVARLQQQGQFHPGWGEPLDFALRPGQLLVLHGREYDAKVIPLDQTPQGRNSQPMGHSALRGYDLASGETLWTYEMDATSECGALHPRQDIAAVVEATHQVSAFDLVRRKRLWSHPMPLKANNSTHPLAWSPDGEVLVVAPHRLWAPDSLAFLYATDNGEKLGMLWATDGNFRRPAMTDGARRLATLGETGPLRLWERGNAADGFLEMWQGWAILVLTCVFGLVTWAWGWARGRAENVRGPGAVLTVMAFLMVAGGVAGALVHAAWYTRQIGSWRIQWGQAPFWAVAAGPVLLTLHLLTIRQVLSCRSLWRYVALIEAAAAIVLTLVVLGPIVSSRHYQLVEASTYDRGRFLGYWGWVSTALLGPWVLWSALLLGSGRRLAYLKLLSRRSARRGREGSAGSG